MPRKLILTTMLTLALSFYVGLSFADQMEDAREYFEKKDYRSASIVLKDVLQTSSSNQAARLLLGHVYLEGLDITSAIKEFERARELGAEVSDYLIPLSRAYLLSGLDSKVIALAGSKDSFVNPRDQSEFLVVLGYAYLDEGSFNEAKQSFESALAVDVNAVSLVGNARVAMHENQTDVALELLDQALVLEPSNTEALVAKSNILGSLKKWAEGVEFLSKAIEQSPDLTHLRTFRAEFYAQAGNTEAARQDAEAVLSVHANETKAHYILAILDMQDKNYPLAQQHGEHVLRGNPNHLLAHYALGAAHFGQSHFEQARLYLEKFANSQPQHSLGTRLLGATYLRLGQLQEARHLFEEFDARYSHKDSALLHLLGTAQLYSGDFDSAKQTLARALEIKPELAGVRNKIIFSQVAVGELEAVISELEGSVVQTENSARDQLLLILAYLQQGDLDKAHQQLNIAIAEHPEDSNFYHMRGDLYLKQGKAELAREAFGEALNKNTNRISTLFSLANLESKSNNADVAKGYLERIIASDSGHLQTLMALAQLSERDGDNDSMLGWLKKAKERNPDSTIPVNFLVNFYLKERKPEKANSEANSFYARHKNTYGAISLMARVSTAMGKLNEAKYYLDQLIEINDEDLSHRYQMVEVLIRQKDYEQSVKYLNEILSVSPKATRALTIKVRTLIALKNFETAAEVIAHISEDYPDHYIVDQLNGDLNLAVGEQKSALTAYKNGFSKQQSTYLANALFNIHISSGQLKEASSVLERYLEQMPMDRFSRVRLASTYQKLEESKRAIKHYEFLINNGLADYLVLNNIAGLYWLEGDKRSLVAAKKAHELAPNKAEVSDTYGWILLHLGDKKSALNILQKSASRAPGNPSIRYHLAKAYAENGQVAQAKKELSRLLKDYAGFSERTQALMLVSELN